MAKINTEEFIRRAKLVHGDKFTYEKTHYVNSKTKVIITCPIHGDFDYNPGDFLRSIKPCPGCRGGKRVTLTKDNFIERANTIHNNKYNYDKVGNITKVKDKVIIICPEHGEFEQEVNSHLQGRGCPICAGKKFDLQNYINKANKVWNSKYDYSKFVWKGVNEKVCIICPEHGEFWQLPNNHLKGECGCLQCRGLSADFEKISNTEILIKKAKERFGDKFDYSKTKFINSRTKIKVICPIHGEFETLPYQFLQNTYGCPLCNTKVLSRGEILIEKLLREYKIPFKSQYEIIVPEIAKNSNIIRIDFFVKYKGKQYFIEYNGQQHYKYIPHFHTGGIIDFEKQQKRDKILRDFCNLHNNKVKLLELPYTMKDNEIKEQILSFIDYKE